MQPITDRDPEDETPSFDSQGDPQFDGARVYESGAYELRDPKHPDHYETLVDLWDNREGK